MTTPDANPSELYRQPVAALIAALDVDPDSGLSAAEAAERLHRYGPNELEERGGKRPLAILLEQFSSTMVLILVAAAVVSAFLGKPTETIAISAIIILFGVLGFIQEYRAEQAMAALKQLAVPVVRVLRGGAVRELSARELVPGDVVLLEAGSMVPADLRLVESANLRIQEAALTGESEPVDKITEALDRPNVPLGDRRNMAYMGTLVSYGRGSGVVAASGMQTELGKIASLIQEVPAEDTPLQQRLDQVGKVLALFGIVVAVLVLIIGVLRGEPVEDMFLTAVSVAVAVVPEGLPAVVTVTLALGAQRMLRRQALIRKLPAVETLGSVTVICSDKTGTLTINRMTVTVIDVAGHYLRLAGSGDGDRASAHPAPALVTVEERADLLRDQPATVALVLAAGALANDASLQPDPESGRFLPVGDPTEGALLLAAQQAGLSRDELEEAVPRVGEIPFESERKRMTTVHRLPDGPLPYSLSLLEQCNTAYVAVTKGSVDGLLDISTRIWTADGPVPLEADWQERIRQANDQLAANGVRVLGLAVRPLADFTAEATRSAGGLEQDLIFIGLVGMIDPPRPEVRDAVRVARIAGIRPIMITGDHPLTARFIAHDLGISDNNRVKTGQDLDRFSQEDLEAVIDDVSVYARVSPEHKLRIVETLQRRGQVVAMTGDGVNDSPALKKADIGVAMGITGTDVSKEAAEMVLLNDNFTTIVAAVEEGRVIYDNIRRFVKFSLAGNIGKVLVMLLAPLLGINVALLPLQLLWLNLLTDGLLGLGLGVEPAEPGTMRRPPRPPEASLFSGGITRQIIWVGALIGFLALFVGGLYFDPGDPAGGIWQTMIFTTLAFAQIGQAIATRATERPFASLNLGNNRLLLVMVILVFVLQLLVIY
ncbi:MAG: cation-translocating P-type ATPase, partial [Candidatus Promineifilaceae bacterium]|nr:cation-translocating P-type ATPase [Candidatus Promineifilaceae bacterium]